VWGMTSSASSLRQKPLLRGVSHEIAAFIAALGAIALVSAAQSTRAAIAAGVYGVTLTTLFAMSALYHRRNWSRPAYLVMRRFDHSAIFLLIAGSYTPLCLVLGGRLGYALLAVAWAGAALGVLKSVFWQSAPRPLLAALAVGLGCVAVPVLPRLYRAVGTGGLVLLLIGGLAYSLGALIYVIKRPNPAPAVFGYHEIFHVLVIVAAGCHYAVISGAVAAMR
jgi:hemolysin III